MIFFTISKPLDFIDPQGGGGEEYSTLYTPVNEWVGVQGRKWTWVKIEDAKKQQFVRYYQQFRDGHKDRLDALRLCKDALKEELASQLFSCITQLISFS